MTIEIRTGMAEAMFRHHSPEQLQEMLKRQIASLLAQKIMESDLIDIKESFVNGNTDIRDGVMYTANFVLLTEKEAYEYRVEQQLKKFKTND